MTPIVGPAELRARAEEIRRDRNGHQMDADLMSQAADEMERLGLDFANEVALSERHLKKVDRLQKRIIAWENPDDDD